MCIRDRYRKHKSSMAIWVFTYRQNDHYIHIYNGRMENCCQKVRGNKTKQRPKQQQKQRNKQIKKQSNNNNNIKTIQESIWCSQCSDRYIISLFPTSIPLPPFSPPLVSLMVSVDVKHHVYLLARISMAEFSSTHVSRHDDVTNSVMAQGKNVRTDLIWPTGLSQVHRLNERHTFCPLHRPWNRL